jgi:pyruvate/2-oxoglutarate dehydrogenase complex dihydrolipoamide acyltransferase (E2) component
VTEVRVPEDLWGDDEEGTLSAWLYESGERVQERTVIAQIMLEKAQMDLLSPGRGVLRIVAKEDATIRRGDLVAYLEDT